MVCLDTSFMIDFFRGASGAVKKMQQLDNSNEAVTIAPPTLTELATGAALAMSTKETRRLTVFFAS